MNLLTNSFISLIALLHLYFLVLEMFFWEKPLGLRSFKQSLEKAQASKVLAANQGLYNGFLAAGLLYGVSFDDVKFKVFFLCCIVIAGVYGAMSANKRILYIQALPATLALLLVYFT